jgi:RND superfamily putative drug exporter
MVNSSARLASDPTTVAGAPALARWGRLIHRHRVAALVLSAVALAVSLAALLPGGNLTTNLGATGQARQAEDLIRQQLAEPGRSSFELVLRSSSLRVPEPPFRSAALAAVAPLRTDPRVTAVITPYDATGTDAEARLSRDGHAALVTVYLRDDLQAATAYFAELRSQVRSDRLEVLATGDLAVNDELERDLESDLARAERFSLPISLVLLLLVFGGVVAAVLPLGVGVLAIVSSLAVVFAVSRITDVPDIAESLVTLLGLALAIDYSLFIVSRFREELAAGAGVEAAVATSMATVGRAVLVSGVTVLCGLAGLLFYRDTFLPALGTSAMLTVVFAVAYAFIVLPAMLSLLGPRVNRLRVLGSGRAVDGRFWRRLAGGVMRRPWLLVPTVAALVLVGIPFLHIRFETSDLNLLPSQTEVRRAQQILVSDFPGQDRARLAVVARFPGGDPRSPESRSAVDGLRRAIARQPGVGEVGEPGAAVGRDLVVLDVLSSYPPGSERARGLVDRLRELPVDQGQVLVTGQAAAEADVIDLLRRFTPWAVGFVVAAIYLILLASLRSVLLPAKAVVMTLLSITASFGALVWIFQDGHLRSALGFSPSGIDPAVPVLLFCFVFGLSMDYEVLLLARIQEAYLARRDAGGAVANGLERSGRLITGAAAIMVAVFASFATGHVVLIKAVGLGLALAVAADATVVRCVVVPALMRLFGRANWWAPGRLRHPGLRS